MVTQISDLAATRFAEGFSCSQSVLLSFAPSFGLDLDLAARISVPFGGGMGHLGEVCGAVSGALMVIGLASGSVATPARELRERTYQLVHQFASRFRERHGSLLCRDLLGCDLSQSGALEVARARSLFARCPTFVRDTAEIVAELLQL